MSGRECEAEHVVADAALALPPDIDHNLAALAECWPVAASRARTATRILLQPRQHSIWPDIAWQCSSLTGDGFPFEFSCSTANDAVRYAIEPAPPELHEGDRLRHAVDLLACLGVRRPDAAAIERWQQFQNAARLQYGTFVGARHDGRSDQYKLYIEIAEPSASSFLPRVAGVAAIPVMLGYEPHSGRTECYYRAPRLTLDDLAALADASGVAAGGAALVDLMATVWQRPIRRQLPGRSIGFSLTLPVEGAGVLALFNHASSLFATDRSVRDTLLQTAHRRGWPFQQYERLTRSLQDHQPETMAHTMVTYTARGNADAALAVGFRPV